MAGNWWVILDGRWGSAAVKGVEGDKFGGDLQLTGELFRCEREELGAPEPSRYLGREAAQDLTD